MNKQITLLSVFALAMMTTVSCHKEPPVTDPITTDSPASELPPGFAGGIWFYGTFGPIAYYDRDGHEVGNETEAARQYTFNEVNGRATVEFMQYLGLRNSSNCVTEIYTTKKGTAVFESPDKFTFYPVEGQFKTIKKGCSNNGTTTRKASGAELSPEPYLYELKTTDGRNLFFVYNITDINKHEPVFVYRKAE